MIKGNPLMLKVTETENGAFRQEVVDAYKEMSLVTVTTEDRLRGALIEAVSELEQGHPGAAYQILQDALKLK